MRTDPISQWSVVTHPQSGMFDIYGMEASVSQPNHYSAVHSPFLDLVRFSDLLSEGSRFPKHLVQSVSSFASNAIFEQIGLSCHKDIEPDSKICDQRQCH